MRSAHPMNSNKNVLEWKEQWTQAHSEFAHSFSQQQSQLEQVWRGIGLSDPQILERLRRVFSVLGDVVSEMVAQERMLQKSIERNVTRLLAKIETLRNELHITHAQIVLGPSPLANEIELKRIVETLENKKKKALVEWNRLISIYLGIKTKIDEENGCNCSNCSAHTRENKGNIININNCTAQNHNFNNKNNNTNIYGNILNNSIAQTHNLNNNTNNDNNLQYSSAQNHNLNNNVETNNNTNINENVLNNSNAQNHNYKNNCNNINNDYLQNSNAQNHNINENNLNISNAQNQNIHKTINNENNLNNLTSAQNHSAKVNNKCSVKFNDNIEHAHNDKNIDLVIKGIPTPAQVEKLTAEIISLEQEYKHRHAQYLILKNDINSLLNNIDIDLNNINLNKINEISINDKNITLNYSNKFKNKINSSFNDKNDNNSVNNSIFDENNISNDKNTNNYHTLEFINILHDLKALLPNQNNQTCALTQSNLSKLNSYKIRLEKEFNRFKLKIDSLWVSIDFMWGLLDMRVDELENLKRKYTKYSENTLKILENEDLKLKSIRKERLKDYIPKLTDRLVKMWDKCRFGAQKREQFMIVFNGRISEDSLIAHEEAYLTAHDYWKNHENLLNLVEKRDEMWESYRKLELNQNSVEKFQNRGGALLKEEKMRRMLIKELPKIDSEIDELVKKHDLDQNCGENYTNNQENYGNITKNNEINLDLTKNDENIRENTKNEENLKIGHAQLKYCEFLIDDRTFTEYITNLSEGLKAEKEEKRRKRINSKTILDSSHKRGNTPNNTNITNFNNISHYTPNIHHKFNITSNLTPFSTQISTPNIVNTNNVFNFKLNSNNVNLTPNPKNNNLLNDPMAFKNRACATEAGKNKVQKIDPILRLTPIKRRSSLIWPAEDSFIAKNSRKSRNIEKELEKMKEESVLKESTVQNKMSNVAKVSPVITSAKNGEKKLAKPKLDVSRFKNDFFESVVEL